MDKSVQAFTTSTEILAKNMQGFVKTVNEVLSQAALESKVYNLQTVEIQAQVSAEGKVGFLGMGAAAKGSAGMKIVFERRE